MGVPHAIPVDELLLRLVVTFDDDRRGELPRRVPGVEAGRVWK